MARATAGARRPRGGGRIGRRCDRRSDPGEAPAGTAKHADESRSRPRNEVGEGRGDSRALKEQGADPDPFPAGLKGAWPLRRLAVAHPSLRAFAPLGPRSVWLRRPRIGVLPAVRLGVALSSSRPLSFSPPVRLLSVFAPLSWLASLARWFVPLPLSSCVVLSVCVPRPVRRLLRIPVPRLRRAPGVLSRRPLRVLPVIVTSSRAPRSSRSASIPRLRSARSASLSPDCVVLDPDRFGPDPRSPVPGTSPPPRRSSSRPDRHPAEGVSVRRVDGGPRHSYRPAVRVQCVPRIVAPGAAVRPAVSVRIALRFGADSRQHRGGAARRTLMRPQARRGTTVPTPHRRSRAIRVCPETDRAKPIRSRAGPPCGTEDR